MQIFNADEDIREKYNTALLLDYYGSLLKKPQADMTADYFFNDMSLSEIAADNDTSRQSVYDTVKRSVAKLENYEELLGLVSKHGRLSEKIADMEIKLARLKELTGDTCEATDLIEELSKELGVIKEEI